MDEQERIERRRRRAVRRRFLELKARRLRI